MLFRTALFISLLALAAPARAQVSGCTDPLAVNYNAAATQNDGSCSYASVSITATQLAQLSDTIRETSGLLYWNGTFWTHNDDTDTGLYAIDTADGHIIRRVSIAGAPNHDWEDITQDSAYLYIGDFGNNGSGNRQDLVILRIPKAALLAGQSTITPDRIFFSYADQTGFAATAPNSTDFDCEAFIAAGDSLYLFTKQWLSGKTKLYALPKTPGTHSPAPRAEYNTDGLVTGATFLPDRRVVALSGYKIAGLSFQPFVYLLYDYSGADFLSGNKRKILVNPAYHQTEGIATIDGRRFFLTNEKLTQAGITISQKLQRIDCSPFLNRWYGALGAASIQSPGDSLAFYPNPAAGHFTAWINTVKSGRLESAIYDAGGRQVAVQAFTLRAGRNELTFERAGLAPGSYLVKLSWDGGTARGKICLQ